MEHIKDDDLEQDVLRLDDSKARAYPWLYFLGYQKA
tara:strand:- start:56 stop:163 length:108 start_codon:yes stop_codon:yes gene_type:complete